MTCTADARFPAVRVLGLRIHAMTQADIMQTIIRATQGNRTVVVANHNLHSLYFWSRDSQLRAFYDAADYVHIDGMPLVLIGKLLGTRLRRIHRTANLDMLPHILSEAVSREWRLFYLGSRPGVAAKAALTLRAEYPALHMATHDGYFDVTKGSKDNDAVVKMIRAYAPHILMVGMGMPRQELWIQDNRDALTANVILCCGALMDLIGGEIPMAPRWLGPLGLEWSFRLITQPKRTWRRYLLEPWSIAYHVGINYVGHKHLVLGPVNYDLPSLSGRLVDYRATEGSAATADLPEASTGVGMAAQ